MHNASIIVFTSIFLQTNTSSDKAMILNAIHVHDKGKCNVAMFISICANIEWNYNYVLSCKTIKLTLSH